MSGFEKQTYTQVPNSLFEIMGEMDECELKVVMFICRYTFGYHREKFTISTRKMADAIGMSVSSVAKGAEAAERRGLIERVNDGQNSTEWRAIVNDGDSNSDTPASKVIQKMNHVIQNLVQGVSENESQVGLNKDKESNKETTATPVPERPEMFTTYEQEIGIITPAIARELQMLESQYPQGWMVDAFKIASERNRRSLGYVRGILSRWKAEGRGDAQPKEEAPKEYEAPQPDPEDSNRITYVEYMRLKGVNA